jgi:RNA polymerase sigma factor (sigma-70 family)
MAAQREPKAPEVVDRVPSPERPATFEQIYDRHVVGIYRFVYARVGNRPDAEDLTAQVFTRAVEQLDTGREPGQIAAWLYRVAQNAIADYWRAFYRIPIVAGDEGVPRWEWAGADAGQPAPATDGEHATRRVEVLLRRLPEHYRRVLELRFLQRLSVAETAARMGISPGNAKVLQYRAPRKAALLGEAGADG